MFQMFIKRNKVLLLSFILAIMIELITAVLRGYVHIFASSVTGFLLYSFMIFFVGRRHVNKTYSCVAGAILGILILQLPIRVYDFKSTLLTFPDFIFHLLGVLIGYWCLKGQNIKRVLLSTFILPGLVFFYFSSPYESLLTYANFGSYSGVVEQDLSISSLGIDRNNKSVKKEDLLKKIVLLDFWHTRCAPCFKRFPELQLAHNQYSNDPEVLIFAFNKPLKGEDISYSNTVLEKFNFTFNNLVPLDSSVISAFNVDVYPTCILLDKSGKIRFKGDLDKALDFIPKIKKEEY